MKNTKINIETQKKILLKILEYVDEICRKNGIKYTLYYGSLIGAVRHHGIIPWDDDIDIALLPEEYEKLIKAIKNDSSPNFILLDVNSENTYYYPFAKIVDKRTDVKEEDHFKINNYGIYIDIFQLNNLPDDSKNMKKYYNRLIELKKKLANSTYDNKKHPLLWTFCKLNSISGYKKLNKKYKIHTEQYNKYNSSYVMSNWPAYGLNREIQSIYNFKEYIDVQFEDMKIMIIKNYDKVLNNIYGDYKTPPPKDKRITNHNREVYWRDKHEK